MTMNKKPAEAARLGGERFELWYEEWIDNIERVNPSDKTVMKAAFLNAWYLQENDYLPQLTQLGDQVADMDKELGRKDARIEALNVLLSERTSILEKAEERNQRLVHELEQMLVYLETDKPGNTFRLMMINGLKAALTSSSKAILAAYRIKTTDAGEGEIMTTKEFLEKHPDPSPNEPRPMLGEGSRMATLTEIKEMGRRAAQNLMKLYPECKYEPHSSRTCERGTRSCNVRHLPISAQPKGE